MILKITNTRQYSEHYYISVISLLINALLFINLDQTKSIDRSIHNQYDIKDVHFYYDWKWVIIWEWFYSFWKDIWILWSRYIIIWTSCESLATGNCRDKFNIVIYSWLTNYYQYQGNISSRFSTNSEASASENLEEMFPRYYMHSNV